MKWTALTLLVAVVAVPGARRLLNPPEATDRPKLDLSGPAMIFEGETVAFQVTLSFAEPAGNEDETVLSVRLREHDFWPPGGQLLHDGVTVVIPPGQRHGRATLNLTCTPGALELAGPAGRSPAEPRFVVSAEMATQQSPGAAPSPRVEVECIPHDPRIP